MAEANSDQPADDALVFRMGLHLSDLIVDGDDLYGDGVNIAARPEGEAPAGGIMISRTVHEAVMGRLTATFHDLGRLALRNLERPRPCENPRVLTRPRSNSEATRRSRQGWLPAPFRSFASAIENRVTAGCLLHKLPTVAATTADQ
jgi:class 3 adenylate cyclase